jgi:hypothetical protein
MTIHDDLGTIAGLRRLIQEKDEMDALRESVNVETARADTWKERAEVAEKWHWEAAAALADCRRRFTLPDELKRDVDKLLAWRPE